MPAAVAASGTSASLRGRTRSRAASAPGADPVDRPCGLLASSAQSACRQARRNRSTRLTAPTLVAAGFDTFFGFLGAAHTQHTTARDAAAALRRGVKHAVYLNGTGAIEKASGGSEVTVATTEVAVTGR